MGTNYVAIVIAFFIGFFVGAYYTLVIKKEVVKDALGELIAKGLIKRCD